MVKNLSANAGDLGSISGAGRSPGEGNDNLLQYSCLENSMNRGVWQVRIHRVPKSQTQLSVRAHTHTHSISMGLGGIKGDVKIYTELGLQQGSVDVIIIVVVVASLPRAVSELVSICNRVREGQGPKQR